MKIFRDCSDNEEDFKDFQKKLEEDDLELRIYLDGCSHDDFVSALIKIGTLLDITTDYLDFAQNYIRETSKDKKQRFRMLNKFLNDLNKRVNMEFGFDEDTLTIEEGVLHDSELHLFVRKCDFLKR